MNNNENALNLTDTAIERPEITARIIESADALSIPRNEIAGLIIDAMSDEEAEDDARDEFFGVLADLLQSDEDYDIASHDVSHATNTLDYCDEHPNTCSECCDLH